MLHLAFDVIERLINRATADQPVTGHSVEVMGGLRGTLGYFLGDFWSPLSDSVRLCSIALQRTQA